MVGGGEIAPETAAAPRRRIHLWHSAVVVSSMYGTGTMSVVSVPMFCSCCCEDSIISHPVLYNELDLERGPNQARSAMHVRINAWL